MSTTAAFLVQAGVTLGVVILLVGAGRLVAVVFGAEACHWANRLGGAPERGTDGGRTVSLEREVVQQHAADRLREAEQFRRTSGSAGSGPRPARVRERLGYALLCGGLRLLRQPVSRPTASS